MQSKFQELGAAALLRASLLESDTPITYMPASKKSPNPVSKSPVSKSSISKYEQQRLDTIAANRAKLIALGIESAAADLRAATKPQRTLKGAGVNKRPKPEGPPPRMRSLRIQNLDADGKPIPDKPVLPSPTPEVVKRPRKTSAPLDASKVSTGATSAEEATAFLARLGSLSEAPSAAKKGGKKGKPEMPGVLDVASLSVACLLYTSPSPRDRQKSRMPSSA